MIPKLDNLKPSLTGQVRPVLLHPLHTIQHGYHIHIQQRGIQRYIPRGQYSLKYAQFTITRRRGGGDMLQDQYILRRARYGKCNEGNMRVPLLWLWLEEVVFFE